MSRFPIALAAAAALGACRPVPQRDFADSTGGTSRGAAPIAHVTQLEDPESVRYDPEQDVFFISNMLGDGSVKDGAGFIVRVNAADLGQVTRFIESGKNGAVLDAPKGMAIVGDTLWVTDIDVVRGFDKRTGAPVGTIDFSSFAPTLLNDIAPGPNGTMRVSDTGILMTPKGVIYKGGDRIFEIDAHRQVRVVAEGASLARPNGLAWDAHNNRWLLVNFGPFESALSALPAGGGPAQTLSRAKGKNDGVEVLDDGRVLYTSWADSSLHVWSGGRDAQLIRNLPVPADLGVDTRRLRVAIPLTSAGRVEIWALPPRDAG